MIHKEQIPNINFYFCGSIRGGRQYQDCYKKIITYLKKFGTVLTEHVGFLELEQKEKLTNSAIYQRDMTWIKRANIVIAETSIPSIGIGYEIAQAEFMNKPIIILHDTLSEYKISAMINPTPDKKIVNYTGIQSVIHNLSSPLKKIIQKVELTPIIS